ncbi:MAG TPA: hypothetical protein VG477_06145 [Thermoanaerobaculia bacterium]|nr:hypothetical protein [Thermoanaerobaculia bacterium]
MSKESVAKTILQWERLIAASESNSADLDYLAAEREELREKLAHVKTLKQEQDALTAAKQQVTRNLDAAKADGREIAVRMRYGIKSRYGQKDEKLVQFGLKPRRKPRRRSQKELEPKEKE